MAFWGLLAGLTTGGTAVGLLGILNLKSLSNSNIAHPNFSKKELWLYDNFKTKYFITPANFLILINVMLCYVFDDQNVVIALKLLLTRVFGKRLSARSALICVINTVCFKTPPQTKTGIFDSEESRIKFHIFLAALAALYLTLVTQRVSATLEFQQKE